MKNQPIPEVLQNIRLVATDMDGTLTQKGKLTSGLISALESLLRTSNIDLVILIIVFKAKTNLALVVGCRRGDFSRRQSL